MKRKEHSPGMKEGRESVYRRPAQDSVKWSGTVERLAWGGMGVGRGEDGRLILLEAPLALFPGEKVEALVRWKPRHGEGQVTAWTRRDPRRVRAACPVAGICGGCSLWEAGPLAGAIIHGFGYPAVFLGTAGAVVVALVTTLWLSTTRREGYPDLAPSPNASAQI